MKRSKKVTAAVFALTATMIFGNVMNVMADIDPEDVDVSVSDNTIEFTAGGGGEITPPVDPEEPDKKIDPDEKERPTGNTGDLRLDVVPVFDFGTQQLAVGTKSYFAELPKDTDADEEIPYYVQVTDLRGTGDGWSLSAKMTSQFSDGTHELNGAEINLTNVASEAQAGTTAPGNTFDETLSYDGISGGSLVKLASAAVDEGMGVSAIRFGDTDRDGTSTLTADQSVELTIPADTQIYANEYTATIQWTLGVTP